MEKHNIELLIREETHEYEFFCIGYMEVEINNEIFEKTYCPYDSETELKEDNYVITLINRKILSVNIPIVNNDKLDKTPLWCYKKNKLFIYLNEDYTVKNIEISLDKNNIYTDDAEDGNEKFFEYKNNKFYDVKNGKEVVALKDIYDQECDHSVKIYKK